MLLTFHFGRCQKYGKVYTNPSVTTNQVPWLLTLWSNLLESSFLPTFPDLTLFLSKSQTSRKAEFTSIVEMLKTDASNFVR